MRSFLARSSSGSSGRTARRRHRCAKRPFWEVGTCSSTWTASPRAVPGRRGPETALQEYGRADGSAQRAALPELLDLVRREAGLGEDLAAVLAESGGVWLGRGGRRREAKRRVE